MNLPAPEWLLTLDSTNSYLLKKFEEKEKLPDGYTVVAQHQTAGRGQRAKKWKDETGKSLLFSLGGRPAADLSQQALFCFGVAVTVAELLEQTYEGEELAIKWPNDLYIQDCKLGGILIENILRGNQWQIAVVGLGLNLYPYVSEEDFYTKPAFLAEHTQKEICLPDLVRGLQKALAQLISNPLPADLLDRYNERLYRHGMPQTFETNSTRWLGTVERAQLDGTLLVTHKGQARVCTHGIDLWVPGLALL